MLAQVPGLRCQSGYQTLSVLGLLSPTLWSWRAGPGVPSGHGECTRAQEFMGIKFWLQYFARKSPISLRLVPLLGTGLTMRGLWRAQVRDGRGGAGRAPPGPALRTHRVPAVVTMPFFPWNASQVFRLCDASGVIVTISPEVPLQAWPQHPC